MDAYIKDLTSFMTTTKSTSGQAVVNATPTPSTSGGITTYDQTTPTTPTIPQNILASPILLGGIVLCFFVMFK